MEKERAERIKNYNRQRDAKDYFTEITWDENVPQGKELEAHDGQFVRLAQHSCLCDGCRLMDKIDNRILELTKKYLSGEWNLDTWWDAVNADTNSEDDIALNRFNDQFDTGPVNLKNAIENVVWTEYYPDPWNHRDLTTERELKLKVEGIIYGYLIRQRTVHQWEVTHRPGPDRING